jgi:hypothetical protein
MRKCPTCGISVYRGVYCSRYCADVMIIDAERRERREKVRRIIEERRKKG